MALSWIVIAVLASTLSQETICFVFGPIPSLTSNASPVQADGFPHQSVGVSNSMAAVSRRPEMPALRLPGPQRLLPIHQDLADKSDAIYFPSPDESENQRFERSKRQLGFFNPGNPQRPNNFNSRPNNGGNSGFTFPSDPPFWGNGNGNGNGNPPRRPNPNRPTMGRPQWPQRPPQVSRPNGNENLGPFVFDGQPPLQPPPRVTTKRPSRPTPPKRPAIVTVAPATVTRPTPASTRAGCNCPTTPEFNPVCGADRVTYFNAGRLRCANFCGNTVQMVHMGSCITTTTPAPTTPSRLPAGVGANRRDSWAWR